MAEKETLEEIQEAPRKVKKSVRIAQRKEEIRERKEQMAGKRGAVKASLNNVPTSPRKMRLVADLVRGQKVDRALNILRFDSKVGSEYIEKLLLSAISNWANENEDRKIEDANLYIKEIFVDGGRMLKRLRPAPQGRGHRIRKRSNHITIVIDSLNPADADNTTSDNDNTENEN
ncbi:50S ribosomal protein L22 [Microscilla marina]|uniref:Large ribosomal subunit protein uL22 n=2 Tax=Microscilla TaxID=1023 RepID=A1ZGS0_MICM2|nr:50S ribosomal protein L22 [Microscilla marina ATCC 23134]